MGYQIQKVIDIEKSEVGYLEKHANCSVPQLYSKTDAAGYDNWTKYWHEAFAKYGLPNYQGSYYCMMFQFWCFILAFGLAAAQKLFHQTFPINCQDTYDAFPASQRSRTPQVGALVVFWNGSRFHHVELVAQVGNGVYYTIGGNTGAHSAIANGGGVFGLKQYSTSASVNNGDRFLMPDYGEQSSPATKNYLSINDSGEGVKQMQKMLNVVMVSDGYHLDEDGQFGEHTEECLMAFQKAYGLQVDGCYGQNSKAKLESAYAVMCAAIPSTGGMFTTNVLTGQKYFNTYYANIVTETIGHLLVADGDYGSESRRVALALWKDYMNRTIGAGLDIRNENFGDSCKGFAAKVPVGMGVNPTGILVYIIEFILPAKGYYNGGIDGQFGQQCDEAVKKWQKANGLEADGVVGQNSWYKLFN